MAITAGTLSQLAVTDTTASLLATAVTGATGPTTYQWYKSTTTGFSPDGGSIIAGATALALTDTGLVPNTQYYYKVIATDTGHSNDQVTYTQLAVATTTPQLNPNQFSESNLLGKVDLAYNYNTIAVQVDGSQATPLFFGYAVKIVDSKGGLPKVVGCTANTDSVLGFVNFNIKNTAFVANDVCEISMAGNVIALYATGAIPRGVQVVLDLTTKGGVQAALGNTSDTIVGWSVDKADARGQLIRVHVLTPSFKVV